MEPLTTAAIAIGTIVATQALETTTEKVTEAVFEKGKGFLSFLRQESPETVTAIEKAPQQPLNYGDVVLAVERAAQASPQVRETMEALVMTAQGSEIPNLGNILQDIATALKSQQQKVENYSKIAEEIKAEKGAMTAQKIEIHQQTNNYN
jgi:hypothetical protein